MKLELINENTNTKLKEFYVIKEGKSDMVFNKKMYYLQHLILSYLPKDYFFKGCHLYLEIDDNLNLECKLMRVKSLKQNQTKYFFEAKVLDLGEETNLYFMFELAKLGWEWLSDDLINVFFDAMENLKTNKLILVKI
jgi:hypothetical protein